MNSKLNEMSDFKNHYTGNDSNYLQNNPTWHIEDSSWKAKQILQMIEKNQISSQSIAEIGCGVGEILNQLYKKLPEDIDFSGYDISIDAIQIAKEKENERLKYERADINDIHEKFDLILLIDVFEHVEDYLGFLKTCRKIGKKAIFHIPLDIHVQGVLRNLPMKTRNAVGHLHYFTKDTAIATLEDVGYNVTDYFYTKGSLELHSSIKSKLAAIPRSLLFGLNQNFAAKLLGGFSLLVFAE